MNPFKNFLTITVLSSIFISGFSQTGAIRLNQVGYYPESNKIALAVFTGENTFEVINIEDNSVAYTGTLSQGAFWTDAGDSIRSADFSELKIPGRYKIRIPGAGESHIFEISNTAWRKAAYASLKSYYYQRCSFELEESFAGLWSRAAGHVDTACVLHPSTGKSGKISSPGGWYDAGDYGKYVVNAGISVASMLSFHENYPGFFADSSIMIPESGNGRNDLLDEVKYELDWLKTMQDEDGGVFHKLTTLNFIGFIMPEAATQTRYVIGKSSAATLDFAAMMAMAGRIYNDTDSSYASDCITRAKAAWSWAKENPAIYFKNPSDVSTGEYGNGDVSDEFIWAAAELYITTGEAEFKTYLEQRKNNLNYNGTPGWPNVQALASLSLATRPNGLSESMLSTIRNSIISTSNSWLTQINDSPGRIPNFGFYWGSNSGIANTGVGLLYAYTLSGDSKFIRGAAECADYILGRNATGFSFVSLYGSKTPMNFHHRPSGADGIRQPVPGFVAGGPNKNREDGQGYPFSEPAKSYVDVVGSYASNEICINWNSPLTVLLAGVDAVLGDQSEVEFPVISQVNNPPVVILNSPKNNETVKSNVLIVEGTATDPEGISKIELYIDAHFQGKSDDGYFQWSINKLAYGEHTITILAFDESGLCTEVSRAFILEEVYEIPGKVEAEHFSNMSGVTTEACMDTGGGKNLTSIETGDWSLYSVDVLEPGEYRVEFRVASSKGGGILDLRKMSQSVISSNVIDETGGDQAWVTISDTISLSEGPQLIRLWAAAGGWNINWMDFIKVEATSISDRAVKAPDFELNIQPNPITDKFLLQYTVPESEPLNFTIYDLNGKIVAQKTEEASGSLKGEFLWQLDTHPAGFYYLTMRQGGGRETTVRLVKSR